jgi:hypothetical protein
LLSAVAVAFALVVVSAFCFLLLPLLLLLGLDPGFSPDISGQKKMRALALGHALVSIRTLFFRRDRKPTHPDLSTASLLG